MPSTHLSLNYHLVFSTKNRLPMITKEWRADSSSWVHEVVGSKKFEWQAGYLGVTVSPSQIELVKNYVLYQEDHFQEEYLELLKLSAIEYDERYVW